MQFIISGLQAALLQTSLYIKLICISVLSLGLIPRVGETGSRDRIHVYIYDAKLFS